MQKVYIFIDQNYIIAGSSASAIIGKKDALSLSNMVYEQNSPMDRKKVVAFLKKNGFFARPLYVFFGLSKEPQLDENSMTEVLLELEVMQRMTKGMNAKKFRHERKIGYETRRTILYLEGKQQLVKSVHVSSSVLQYWQNLFYGTKLVYLAPLCLCAQVPSKAAAANTIVSFHLHYQYLMIFDKNGIVYYRAALTDNDPGHLFTEIQRTASYYQQTGGAIKIENILLAGLVTQEAEFEEHHHKQVKQILGDLPLRVYTPKGKIASASNAALFFPLFMAAAEKRLNSKFNFYKASFKKWLYAAAAILTIALLAANIGLYTYSKQVDQAIMSLRSFKQQVLNEKELLEKTKQQYDYYVKIKTLLELKEYPLYDLSLVSSFPDAITLKSMEYFASSQETRLKGILTAKSWQDTLDVQKKFLESIKENSPSISFNKIEGNSLEFEYVLKTMQNAQ